MNAEKFWYAWLKITLLLLTIFGIILVILSRTPFLDLINDNFNHLFFANHLPDNSTILLQGWLIVIIGSIMATWSLIMLYIINNSMKRKEFWSWKCIFYSFLAWFIIDTSVSIYYQAAFNIIINCVVFFQVAAPLLYLKNSFKTNLQVSS